MQDLADTGPDIHDAGARPIASVLMPVHNGEEYLPAALDSILSQDLPNFELIVVDDCSGPEAAAVLADYARKDPRIRVFRNAERQGVARTLNKGLKHCRAEYTARADADDVYLPDRLSRQIAFLQDHPQIGVVSCGYHRMRQDGKLLDTVAPPTNPQMIAFERLFINRLLHPGVMFRTQLIREAGGYDPAFWTAQDSDLWARLALTTRLANLAEPLVYYRVHAKSVVRSRGAEGMALSYSVPEREITAYLRSNLPARQLRAMIDLYRGFEWLALADVRLAERGLRHVHAAAVRREHPAIVRQFSRSVAACLFVKARAHRRASPLGAVLLAAHGWRWRLHSLAGPLGNRRSQESGQPAASVSVTA